MTIHATAPLKRHPDWQQRLLAYIGRCVRRPYRPGENDCALFAAGAVEAMTGVDLAQGWRGYATLEEGFERLRAAGFDDHAALVSSVLPPVEPCAAFARPGDIAAVVGMEGMALGIVQGEGIYVFSSTGRIGTVPLSRAVRAWRV